MRAAALALALSILSAGSAIAGSPAVPFSCAATRGIKTEVEFRTPRGQKTKIVNITFIGKRPTTKEIDRILRACVMAASKSDATQDILGTAWLRKRAGDDPNDDETINIYGPLSYLSYQASTKTIDVRYMNLNGK